MTDVQAGSLPDRELVRAYVEQGSAGAFAALARRYSKLIYTICLRETGEPTLAADCAQNVLVLLSQKSRSIAGRDSLAGWLYAVSRNVSRNALRQERRRRQAEVASAMVGNMPIPIGRDNPLWDEIEPHFHQALDRLKPDEREAVLLRFVNDQSLQDLAFCFGISENAARMRVSRALEKIRRHLRHAGIVVGIAALSSLLEAHSAAAMPVAVGERLLAFSAKQAAVRSGTARPWPHARPFAVTKTSVTFSGIAAILLFAGSGYVILNAIQQRPLDAVAQRRFFASVTGNWQGTLEFVDDRSGRRFRYPTNVTISVHPQGGTDRQSLILTAKYVGSNRVDVTTFAQQSDRVHVAARNGGPDRSHGLDCEGLLTLSGSGVFVLEGVNAVDTRETRIEFSLTGRQLSVRELYRDAPFSRFEAYGLRNHFTLQH